MTMLRSYHAFTSRGFTLLEVLMVVLVVGIISGVAMLSFNAGGAERHLQDESDRLAALITQASDEAVMQNQEYGLKITDRGYYFLCLNEVKQRWKSCPAEGIFREREMPDGLEIHLLREGKMKFPLATKDDEAKNAKPDKDNEDEGPRINPDIFLLSSGEASPASLEIQVTDKPVLKSEIVVDAIGRVSRRGDTTYAARNAGKQGDGRDDN